MGQYGSLGCVIALGWLAAACSSMPADGPLLADVVDRASAPTNSVNLDYVLVEVTDPILNALASRPFESLSIPSGLAARLRR